jgi:hypothetical protein
MALSGRSCRFDTARTPLVSRFDARVILGAAIERFGRAKWPQDRVFDQAIDFFAVTSQSRFPNREAAAGM